MRQEDWTGHGFFGTATVLLEAMYHLYCRVGSSKLATFEVLTENNIALSGAAPIKLSKAMVTSMQTYEYSTHDHNGKIQANNLAQVEGFVARVQKI